MPTKLLLFILLCPFVSFSQDIEVRGKIVDQQNLPIAYANVVLKNSEDSKILHGAVSNDDGHFVIKSVSPATYTLEISFIGFTTYETTLELTKVFDLHTITLQESAENLDAVNLVVKQPTFKKQSDRIVFNIEQTSLTEGSVMDVLKSTPGVLIMNDEISVKNNTNIIYLINDKRVYLSGEDLQILLSGTNATYVQEVEVITNPPAKFDAEGAAVINIKMSKNLITGYNGSLYANYTQGIHPRFKVGMNHFYKTDKLNIFANYSYGEREINLYDESTVNFIENNAIVGEWSSIGNRDTKSKSHNANANIDYTFNDANVLSFSANVNVTPYWKRHGLMETEAIDSSFVSVNDIDDSKTNIAANLDYVHTSESGQTLSVNLHHTNYDYDRYQDINSDYFDVNHVISRQNEFNSVSNQKTKIYSGQLDYSMTLNTDVALDFGVKFSAIDSDSDVAQFYSTKDRFINDEINSGVFNYNEENYAAYVNSSKYWDNWSISVGLRGEFTDVEGLATGSIDKGNSFDYFKLFPTFNVSHDFNESHSLGLSYGKRIARPTYASLNPFKYYYNDFAYLQGNPSLQPTISHLTTLSYTLKGTYTFEVYYRYEIDPINELVFQNNNSNRLIYLPTNLDKSIDYGFDFMTYKPITAFWSVYFINSIFHETAYFNAEQSGGITETNETWAMYTNVMNFFSFLEDRSLNGEISLLYLSPMINGSSNVSSRTQVDLGVKKSFNNGKWVVSLKASDIFRTTDFTLKNQYLNQDNSYYSRFDNQWIRFGLRYNFGNTKLKTNEKEAKELNERNRLNNEGADH
ncbi:TonB-dependent receptor [Formosa agariphila KMM 3901]|uniref:TonB-dependent receptor n=1 Tax=Formosa agariphila (strain DSM 15362 / KCTC 12365 / LMG 23005 / KMM 3901 / M-2Alg 35-1) TaxID=1347342 RepID=T2KRC7_FORAG|nr:outer membrane beta-barrel family protein [Formosa agariphila]CDF81280.1 TonB-dependent receptor [Formosa agariphila KMM 3901]